MGLCSDERSELDEGATLKPRHQGALRLLAA